MGQDGDTQGTEYNCDYHAVSRRVTGRPAFSMPSSRLLVLVPASILPI